MTAARALRGAGVAVCVLAAVAAVSIARALPLGYDFEAYWLAGQHLRFGTPLYPGPGDPLGQAGQFKYLPIVAVPFVPLALLPLDIATLVWLAVEIAAAAAVGVALVRGLSAAARPWAAAGYILFLPLVLELTLGNLDLISVAFALLAWHWRRSPVRAAVPLAIAVGLKLLPAALLFFYLAAGRWRVVAYATAAGVIALALTAPWLGSRLVEYAVLFPRLSDTTWIRQVIAREEPPLLAAALWSDVFLRALSLAALAAVVMLGVRARGRTDETLLHHTALAIAPYLAPFAFVWTTFLVASLPLFAVATARALARHGWARLTRLAAIAVAWALLQTLQLHDLVPVAAHLVGVGLLVGVALSTARRHGQSAPTTIAMRT